MAQKCVHQGCGKEFTDATEKCEYHPGPPVFHEGQKGWNCCKPRVLDFDKFLSIPPCTIGTHSTTDKPRPIEARRPRDDVMDDAATGSSTIQQPQRCRESASSPQVKQLCPPPDAETDEDDASLEIADGALCRRRACGYKYSKRSAREDERCVHHPGAPIFHEGSKGYTCCKKRVLDFDQFMKIEGCQTKTAHLFIGSGKGKQRKASGDEISPPVRHDYYQTPTSVVASFFLKNIVKDTARVKFERQQLILDLTTSDSPPKHYSAQVPLFGPIDVESSAHKVLGTKLEVTLVKENATSWPVLRSDEPPTGEILQVGRPVAA